MKIRYYFLLIITCSFFSCEKELYQDVSFDISISPESIVSVNNDTIVVNSNTPVTFNINGEPDVITFFSGEKNHEYEKRELYNTPVEDIESSELVFSHLPRYGVVPNTLKVYLSTDFNGLLLNDKTKDSIAVLTHNWIDITDKCNLSSSSKKEQKTNLSLKEYLQNNLTIAFQYITNQNEDIQPSVEILGLEIANTMKNGDKVVIKAIDMGFSPIDLFEMVNPYISNDFKLRGMWYTGRLKENPSVMRIELSHAGEPMNNDWLISKPVALNKRLADTGTQIKNITVELDNYNYVFTTPGTYKTTFLGRNYNFKNSSEKVKQLYVKVI